MKKYMVVYLYNGYQVLYSSEKDESTQNHRDKHVYILRIKCDKNSSCQMMTPNYTIYTNLKICAQMVYTVFIVTI